MGYHRISNTGSGTRCLMAVGTAVKGFVLPIADGYNLKPDASSPRCFFPHAATP